MKKILGIGFITLLSLNFSSCIKEPVYPDYPILSTNPTLTANCNGTATLQINFTDGNGAIGYPAGDADAPNFYMEMLQDSAGIFSHLTWQTYNGMLGDTVGLIYNVPDITPTGKNKSISGQIQVQMAAGQGQWWLKNNTYYKFIIWLVDRNGHVSNRVITPEILSPAK